MQIEQHADRKEEQPEQDRAERLDVGLELMPVGRFGEHDAGDEGAERGRQTESAASPRRQPITVKSPIDDEQLALAEAADQPENGIEDEPAERDQPNDGNDGIEREPSSRSARSGRAAFAPWRR